MAPTIGTVVMMLLVGTMKVPAGCVEHPTDVSVRPVPPAPNLIVALEQLGKRDSICFGIELTDLKLTNVPVQSSSEEPVREFLSAILESAPEYAVRASGSVILIAPRLPRRQSWLDVRIPRFVCQRGPVMDVNNLLRRELRVAENPTLRLQGWAGSFPAGNPSDLVGPFDERNKTVREILNLIVGSSKGALWITTGSA